MDNFISPSRRCLKENAPLNVPFSARNSRNVLEDYKGSQNKEIKVKVFLENIRIVYFKKNYYSMKIDFISRMPRFNGCIDHHCIKDQL